MLGQLVKPPVTPLHRLQTLGSGTHTGLLSCPLGLACAGERVYIADTGHYCVRQIDRQGIFSTVAGTGREGLSGLGDLAVTASLSRPVALALDSQQRLYLALPDSHQVLRLDTCGVLEPVAGCGQPGFSGDGGPALEARLYMPYGLAIDAQDRLYIADSLNHRIRCVDPDGRIWTLAGSGPLGSHGGSFAGDGGPARQARLNRPTGVAVAADGSLYIADFLNHRVRHVSPERQISTLAGKGQAGWSGDGDQAQAARLNAPFALACDRRRNVYIADRNNHCVRRVQPDGLIDTLAGTGEPGFNGDGQPATAIALNMPFGLALDACDGLYIADTFNHRIRYMTL